MPGLKNVPNIRLSKTTLCHKNHLNLSLIYFHLRITLLKFLIKFGLSEKPTKFEKICLMVLTNQLIYLVNGKTIRQIFSNYVCFSKSPNFNSSFQTFHLPKLCPIFVNLAWFKKYNNLLGVSLVLAYNLTNFAPQSSNLLTLLTLSYRRSNMKLTVG